MVDKILPRVQLITPNIAEAHALLNTKKGTHLDHLKLLKDAKNLAQDPFC